MSRHDKHIDDLFKDELGSYTETPPPAVWDSLEKRLDDNGNKKSPFVGWFVSLLIVCGVALLSISIASKTGILVSKKEAMVTKEQPAAATKNNSRIVTKDEQPVAKNKTVATTPIKTAHTNHISARKTESIPANTNDNTSDGIQPATEQPAIAAPSQPVATIKPVIAGPDVEKRSKKHNILVVQTEPEHAAEIAAANQKAAITEINDTKPIPTATAVDKRASNTSAAISASINNNTTIKNDVKPVKQVERAKPITPQVIAKVQTQDKAPVIAADKKADAPVTLKHKTAKQKSIVATQSKKEKKAVHNTSKQIATKTTADTSTVKYAASVNLKKARKHTARKHADTTGVKYALTADVKETHKHTTKKTTNTTGSRFAATADVKKISKHVKKQAAASDTSKNLSVAPHVKVKKQKAEKIVARTSATNVATVTKGTKHKTAAKQTPPQKNVPIANLQLPVTNNVYNGKLYQPAGSIKTANDRPAYVDMSAPKNIAAQQPVDTTTPQPIKDSMVTAIKAGFKHFEFGVKAGYEGGVSSGAANKIVLSPYIQYKLSPRLSVMTQPAIKEAYLSVHTLSGTQSFYNATDSNITISGFAIIDPTTLDTSAIMGNYVYTKKHDSIVKSYTVSGKYTEFEIPILLKLSLTKELSVYGGGTMTISKYAVISEHTSITHLTTTVSTPDTAIIIPYGTPLPALSTFSSVISTHGTPLSSYSGPLYPSPQGTLLRFGYMLGFSYEWNKRFMADVLIQQSNAKSNVQGGYDINKPFSLPYFRITLGYKLSK